MFGMPSSSCFSTDRINVWGHYELGNIRWLDESGQMSITSKETAVCMHETRILNHPLVHEVYV